MYKTEQPIEGYRLPQLHQSRSSIAQLMWVGLTADHHHSVKPVRTLKGQILHPLGSGRGWFLHLSLPPDGWGKAWAAGFWRLGLGSLGWWRYRVLHEWPVESFSPDFNLLILIASLSWTVMGWYSGPRSIVRSVLYCRMSRVWERIAVKWLYRHIVVPALGYAL